MAGLLIDFPQKTFIHFTLNLWTDWTMVCSSSELFNGSCDIWNLGIFLRLHLLGSSFKTCKVNCEKGRRRKVFGALDGGRGLVEAILASIALFIFTNVLGDNTALAHKKEALQFVVYMYSTALIVVSVLILIFVKEDKTSIKKNLYLKQLKPVKSEYERF
ncbi:hypothetical protein F6Y04_03500 [Bacillus megaterium]|nr:hypothetical protein [Priestia megaterium]